MHTPDIYWTTFGDRRLVNTRERITQEAINMDIFKDLYPWDETMFEMEYWEKYKNHIERNRRGFGYYIWKPYIIEKTLSVLPENVYLLYTDVGCTLYKTGVPRLLEYVDLLESASAHVLGFHLEYVEKQWTKKDLLIRMNYSNSDQINTPHCLSGIILFKNNEKTRQLVKEWRIIMEEDVHLIDDSPSIATNEPEFVEHRHDQSVFSILLKQYNGVILKDETWWPEANWADKVHYPVHATRLKY